MVPRFFAAVLEGFWARSGGMLEHIGGVLEPFGRILGRFEEAVGHFTKLCFAVGGIFEATSDPP